VAEVGVVVVASDGVDDPWILTLTYQRHDLVDLRRSRLDSYQGDDRVEVSWKYDDDVVAVNVPALDPGMTRRERGRMDDHPLGCLDAYRTGYGDDYGIAMGGAEDVIVIVVVADMKDDDGRVVRMAIADDNGVQDLDGNIQQNLGVVHLPRMNEVVAVCHGNRTVVRMDGSVVAHSRAALAVA